MEKHTGVPKKVWNRITKCSSKSASGYIPKRVERRMSKRCPTPVWERRFVTKEKLEVVTDFLFLGFKISADGDCSHEIRTRLLLDRKTMTNLDSVLKSRHYSASKGPYSQGYGLPRGHIQLWELDCKEGRMPLNCGAGEDSWKSLGPQGDQTSQS